ncbi:MAG TPA: spermidine/putrescine ABC transporter substrate-binding protein [Clostridia bacterium]|nr:spermidine/putrescine ABC transporter substrate-binding protein [Clostridia bacterium]
MRKKALVFMLVFTMLVSTVVMTGCGGSGKSYANGELNIYVWTEYVPDKVIQDFEDQYKIKVNVSTFSTNEDMLAKVKSESEGAFDIVQPSDYMVTQMFEQGMLEKLDQTKLKNLSNIGTQYLNQSYDPGNLYSVPYQGGVGAIAVNTSKITTEITSYADLFKPELKNSMVVLDDYRAVIGMTARSMGSNLCGDF